MDIVAQRPDQNKVSPIAWDGHEAAWYYCSTTQDYYRPLSFDYCIAAGRVYAWVFCPLCDHHCRGKGQDGYDADKPQPHLYTLEKVPDDAFADLAMRLRERRGMLCREMPPC